MSEFQYGLIALGIGVVALVYGYNAWQERRFRRKTEASFRRNQPDALFDTPREVVRDGEHDRLEPLLVPAAAEVPPMPGQPVEPSLADEPVILEATAPAAFPPAAADAVPVAAPAAEPAVAIDPEPEPELPVLAAEPAALPAVEPVLALDSADREALIVAMLDPALDFIAELRFSPPARLSDWPRLDATRRVQMIARSGNGDWLRVGSGAMPDSVAQLNVGLQLVDRTGAVSDAELAAFAQQMQAYAEQYGAQLNLPQRPQKLVAARELDRFCADVDVVIGISLITAKPCNGTKLRSLAEAQGLQLEPDGLFHYLSDSGNSLYTLGNIDNTPFTLHTLLDRKFDGLTLLFDVPRVAGSVAVFDRAIAFARQIAQALDAKMVDDNRRPLTDDGINAIRHQLKHIHSRMDDRGIAPGSVAALRLFA